MASSVLKGVGSAASGIMSPFKLAANAAKGLFSVLNTLPGILGAAGLVSAFGDAINAAKEFESAMVTLEIIAPRFGVSADKAKESAQRLGKELKIGVTPAAEGLQNLLKGGLNLGQAEELLKRFTNEAITGKSSSISLSDAVKNLSFAYATNNSALGNLSGISENFQDIIDKGRKSLVAEGKAAKDVTDDMAKFRGIMDLTNLTLGSSEKFVGTLADTQAELSLRADELKVKVGQFLAPVLNQFLKLILDISDKMSAFLAPAFAEVENIIEIFAPFINEIIEGFEGLNITTDDLKGGFDDFIKTMRGILMPTIEAVKSTVLRIIEVFKKLIDPLRNAFENILPSFVNALKTVWEVLYQDILPVLLDVGATLAEVFGPVLKIIIDVLGVVLPPILDALGIAFKVIGDVVSWLWNSIFKPILNLLKGAWELFFGIVQFGWEQVIYPALVALGTFVKNNIWPIFQPLAEFAIKAFNGVKTVIEGAFNWIKFQVIYPFMNEVDVALAQVNKLIGKADEVKGAQERIKSRANEFYNQAAGGGSVAGPVRKFAKGGNFMTNGPELIMVGDNPGGREQVNVTPVGHGQGGSGSGINITINNNGGSMNESQMAARLAFLIKTA